MIEFDGPLLEKTLQSAPSAATLVLSCARTSGVRRRSAERPLVLVACGTSSTSLAASRMASGASNIYSKLVRKLTGVEIQGEHRRRQAYQEDNIGGINAILSAFRAVFLSHTYMTFPCTPLCPSTSLSPSSIAQNT